MTNRLDDQAQRQQALNPELSFIVQAPAGSGKTELLIQRYLVLLQSVQSPDEIIALTFTKKAANEMRNRIIKALKQSLSTTPPESPHAKLTWHLGQAALKRDHALKWNMLNNPNQLRIQTIDSLCSYITKQLPLLANIGAPPDISDTPTLLYEHAIQNVLSKLETNENSSALEIQWHNDIRLLLKHLDNNLNKLHDLLIHLLAKRDQWLPYIHLESGHDQEIRQALEEQLAAVIHEHLSHLATQFPITAIPELLDLTHFACQQLAESNPDSMILACKELTSLPGTDHTSLSAWQGLAKLLLTDSRWRKAFDKRIGFPAPSSTTDLDKKILFQSNKERIQLLIEELSQCMPLNQLLYESLHLPKPHYEEQQWHVLRALFRLLKLTAAQLRVTFQEFGQIDFIENAQSAILALGTDEQPTDLALSFDYQIKHLLIDEFQDTSITQYRLLQKLTLGWSTQEGRTLFIVGDPMQSIYRFREAEVGLFIRMREIGINHIPLIPLTLSSNFRSTETIVNWNNGQYKSIFPTYNQIASGAVQFSPSRAESKQTISSTVTISAYEDDDGSLQANKTIEIIQHTLDKDPKQTIAVLVRARQHLKKIIPALRAAGIPFHAIDIDPLSNKQAIQDLLSLTRAMINPYDRIAWLAILRAPWCGLTLHDLHAIAGFDAHKTIYECIQDKQTIEALSDDGKKRLSRIIPIVIAAIKTRQRFNMRTWIEQTWCHLGGPASLSDMDEINDIQSYFQLLHDMSMQAEPFKLEKLLLRMEKRFAETSQKDACVQLMTAHSSKGLEFDTVILPHLERKGASNENALLLWMDRPLQNGQQALLLAPIHATGSEQDNLYSYINRQQTIKNDFELSRLLYVATTRAKRNLHLLFSTKKNAKGEFQAISGSLLNKLWPSFEKDIEKYLCITQGDTINNRAPLSSMKRLKNTWNNPLPASNISQTALHRQQSGFLLPHLQPKIVGKTVHLLLHYLCERKTTWWLTYSPYQRQQCITTLLKKEGCPQHELSQTYEKVLQAIEQVLNDIMGRWILDSHEDARSEYAISALFENTIKHMIIDRTFIDKTGTRWIVDYKTALPHGLPLAEFIKAEVNKYTKQLQDYANAFRLIENRKMRLGLYFPLLPHFHEVDTI